MTKAVALLSGGLDSTLAIKLILEQGIGVHALNFTSAFCTCNGGREKQDGGCRSEAKRVAEEFGITIKVLTKGLDYMDIVRNPRHGYGKGINPCVDCRIYMFKLAKKYMEDINASFIITGEVLGQRPMSQRRDTFMTIEKESGLAGPYPEAALRKTPLSYNPGKNGTCGQGKTSGYGRKDKEAADGSGGKIADRRLSLPLRRVPAYRHDILKKSKGPPYS